MDTFRYTDRFVGDEFVFDEYSGLAGIQFSANSSDSKTGGSTATADTVEIEVFDRAHHFVDIYSIPDSDKERLLLKDFDDDIPLARQFTRLIGQNAHIRTAFKQHTSAEHIARQLVLIGQDPSLFAARIIVPNLRTVSADTFMDRIRKSNLQQMIHGHIIRVRQPKKTTPKPEITISSHATKPKTREVRHLGVQFPRSVLATQTIAGAHFPTMMSRDTSVFIDSISIHRLDEYPISRGIIPGALSFDSIGIQDERAAYPYDLAEPYLPQVIDLKGSDNLTIYARVFAYLRLLFQQHFFARPFGLPPCMAEVADIESDFQSTPPITTLPEGPITKRLIAAADLLGISLDFTYSTSALSDFISRDAQIAYWRLRYSDTPMGKILDPIRANIETRAIALQSARDAADRLERAKILVRLIEENFGARKIVTAASKNVIRHDASNGMGPAIGLIPDAKNFLFTTTSDEEEILGKLTPKERTLIEAEFSKYTLAQSSTSNCDHYRLINTLRNAVNVRIIGGTLAQLTKIIEIPRESARAREMIKCSLCKQDAICPHSLAHIRVLVDRSGTRGREREVLAPFIERMPERDAHYCRICGEVFSWSLVVNDDASKVNAEDENLTAEIYHELSVIRRYVRAQKVIDQDSFIKTIEKHIYPFIEAIESKASVAQTVAAAELSAKMRVFIAIYAFADCIVNRERFGIAFDGFVPRTTDHVEAAAIRYATDKIVSIENIALSIVPSITREVVSANLVSAIVVLRNVAPDMPFEAPPRDYRASLMYDPLFEILFSSCPLKSITPTKVAKPKTKSKIKVAAVIIPKANPKDPFDFERRIFEVLPAIPPNPRNVYETLFAQCPSLRQGPKDPATFARATIPQIMRFVLWSASETMRLRAFDYPTNTTNREIVDHRNAISAIQEQLHIADQARYERFHSERNIPAQVIIGTRISNYTAAPLSFLYDEKGNAHKWDILIFRSAATGGATKDVEIKLGSPDAFKGELGIFVDKKCSVCGVLESQTATLDDATIRSSLESRELLGNFYQFFEVRCPQPDADSSGTHVFDDKLICSRCGYYSKLAQNFGDEAREYFKKYLPVFREHLKPAPSIQPIPGRRISPADEAIEASAREIASRPWVFDYEMIVRASTTFNVERHSLQTLGAREGLTRDQIADESFVVRVPKSRIDIRIQTLRSYIIEIFMLYAIVRNSALHEKSQTRSHTQFVDEVKRAQVNAKHAVTSAQFDQIVASMPPISALMNPDSRSAPSDAAIIRATEMFAGTHKPTEIVEYYLETICRQLLAIYTHSSIGETFARAALARIISRENMTAKGDRFSLSVVEGTKLASDNAPSLDVTDDFAGDDANFAAASSDDEQEDADVDPFSLDAFDVDNIRADDEQRDDPDDVATLIHFGDEVGW